MNSVIDKLLYVKKHYIFFETLHAFQKNESSHSKCKYVCTYPGCSLFKWILLFFVNISCFLVKFSFQVKIYIYQKYLTQWVLDLYF